MFSEELINKYAPGANCIEPMKVWKIPDGKEYKFAEVANSGDYFAQIKKDGYWYQYEKTLDGKVYLFSRTTSTTTGILTEKSANVPWIIKALEKVPNGTTIIGEIYYPGKTSKTVTTIMGCLPKKAIERQEQQGAIHYYIHDIIQYKGESLLSVGAYDRYQKLLDCWENYIMTDKGSFPVELAQIFEENIQEKTAEVLNAGEEGMVLKLKTAPYSPGKRPAWHNLKIKKVDYIDAICIGFCDATVGYTGKEIENWVYWRFRKDKDSDWELLKGEYYKDSLDPMEPTWIYEPITKGHYYGWKTAIEIGAYDKNGKIVSIGTVASGLTDELREDFAKNPSKYLNKVVSLQCMEKDSKECTLRHGFFKSFRDDKPIEDCTIENIFN